MLTIANRDPFPPPDTGTPETASQAGRRGTLHVTRTCALPSAQPLRPPATSAETVKLNASLLPSPAGRHAVARFVRDGSNLGGEFPHPHYPRPPSHPEYRASMSKDRGCSLPAQRRLRTRRCFTPPWGAHASQLSEPASCLRDARQRSFSRFVPILRFVCLSPASSPSPYQAAPEEQLPMPLRFTPQPLHAVRGLPESRLLRFPHAEFPEKSRFRCSVTAAMPACDPLNPASLHASRERGMPSA